MIAWRMGIVGQLVENGRYGVCRLGRRHFHGVLNEGVQVLRNESIVAFSKQMFNLLRPVVE
jgi:hypothetical protein